ncbi:glycosyltransferase family 4 protein [Streptomyces massasporeus]|uniref:glycosyltransferase family 4 protein n=1 Tax=Streptomyces massasporeus TaxID=67324 RepID=UPI0037F3DD10
MTRRPRVTVVQPYLHSYRVPFYECLHADMASRGIELILALGSPTGQIAHRSDACVLAEAVQLPQRALPLGPKQLLWRRLGELAHTSDALVLQHMLHCTESYTPLLRSRLRKGPPVALWGQGKAYSYRPLPLASAAKTLMTRLADWFFAYTEQGRRDVEGWGFPGDRITVVRNSTDTRAVMTAAQRTTPVQLAALHEQHGLAPGRTALFIGGLDAPKRIPFLLRAVDRIAAQLPGFRLLVAGEGAQRGLVEKSRAAVWVGRASTEQKALLGAACEVMLMPGAVGLCAVDSFALGTPVVTTHWPFHGVEFGYLEHGRNALVVPTDDEGRYADAVVGLLRDRERLRRLQEGCRAAADSYSVEEMSGRFADGVEQMLARSC